jgi:hypothetical protein
MRCMVTVEGIVITVAAAGRRGETPEPINFQFCHRFQKEQSYNHGFLKITSDLKVIKNT